MGEEIEAWAIGDLVSKSVDTLKANLKELVGGLAVIGGIYFFIFICGFGLMQFPILIGMGDLAIIGVILGGLVLFVGMFGLFYLFLGYWKLILAAHRGEEVSFGMIFQGGRIFALIGAGIIFGIMQALGSVLCIVPGILVQIIFWPYFLIIIDQEDVGPLDAIKEAKRLTEGLWLPSFVLLIVSGIIIQVGSLLCGVGTLATLPIGMLVMTGAYSHMVKARGTFYDPVF